MATAGVFSGGSGEDWKPFLTCSLCLEIFRCPKLLPCHHSFCLTCLEGLASCHGSGSFPCPQCRLDVTVPSGGVAAFQNNFHVNPKDLEKARNGAFCSIHPKQDLDLYCVDCKMPVCSKCAVTDHKSHITEDLDKVARRAIQQLKGDKDRLQKAVSCVKDRVKAKKTEKQSLQDKKSAVAKVIRRKQAWVKSVVDKYCEDSLASLTAVSGDWDSRLTKDLDCEQKILDQLCQLRQDVQEAISSGEGCRVVSVAKEMMEGRGSPQAVNQLMSSERNSIHRPVLSCKVAEDAFLPLVRDYFGFVEMEEIENVTAPEVEIVEKFSCGKEEENVEVFSLCQHGDGCKEVSMSFARRGVRDDAPGLRFSEEGPHRAFDVDSSEQHYVVLEEPGPVPDMQRKVRLYHRGQRHAVATYRPPSAACRPSDVCFWREPGDREILVVADEGTDSLHVVHVRDNVFSFEGYLAPGSPLIIQPTALNTDTRGRLWVALRGGQIITVDSLEDYEDYESTDSSSLEGQSIPSDDEW